MRRLILASILLACVAGCHRVRDSSLRFSKDIFVVVTSVGNAPVAAVKDTYEYVEGDSFGVQLLLFPVLWPVSFLKHGLVVCVHLVDAAVYPFYLPLGLKPMHMYTIDDFPYSKSPNIDKFFLDPIGILDRALEDKNRELSNPRVDPEEVKEDFFDVQ